MVIFHGISFILMVIIDILYIMVILMVTNNFLSLMIQSKSAWWFGTWLDYDFPIILGMSSSQLTNSIIFQRGRYTTNQQFSSDVNWAGFDPSPICVANSMDSLVHKSFPKYGFHIPRMDFLMEFLG